MRRPLEQYGRGWRRGAVAGRNVWSHWLAWFDRLALSEDTILLAFGIVLGVAGAAGVIAFFGLIDAAYRLFFQIFAAYLPHPDFPYYRPVLTAIGFALAATIVRRFDRAHRGSTASVQLIPTIQLTVARRGGELPASTALSRIGASVVTLGSGGAAGSEGAVAMVGATVGSFLARAFRFNPVRVRVLVGAGTAAGISAAFNTPLAGAFFALEEIMGSFTAGAFPPIVVASVVAAMISRSVFGDHPAIALPVEYGYTLHREVFLFFPILGILAGLIAVLFVRTFFRVEDLRARLPIDSRIVPWLGGAAVGLMVLASGGLLVGYGHLAVRLDLFTQLPAWSLALLCLGGIVATSFTLNTGGSGGVFGPSLFIGATAGAAFGVLLRDLLPGLNLQPEAYALVGMGAVFAATADAPLAAVLMVFEMTNDYAIVLPLMLAVVVSFKFAKRIERDSLYSGWLRRRGEVLERGASRDVMASLRVRDAYDDSPDAINENATVEMLLDHIAKARHGEFPVVDADGVALGTIRIADLARVARDHSALAPVLLAADLAVPGENVVPEDDLSTAIRRMGIRGTAVLPVVDAESGRLLGIIDRARILAAYESRLAEQARADEGGL